MPLEMRDASASDYDAFVRLFAELKVPDPVPVPEHFKAHIAPQAFFGFDGEEVRASAYWKPYGALAHVSHLVVDPAHRCRGIGRVVMAEVCARARAAGCTRWYLNVKKDNAPAVALYERCGLRVAFESVLFEIEDDQALASVLCAVGGRPQLQILRMIGELVGDI